MGSYPFVAGSTLTANQLNQYAGLVYIGSFDPVALQTSYAGIAYLVDVDNVFDNSFKNYRVVMSGRTSSQDAPLVGLSVLPITNPASLNAYDSKLFYSSVNTAGGLTESTLFGSSAWGAAYTGNAGTSGCQMDFYAPYVGAKVRFQTSFVGHRFGFAAGATVSSSVGSSHGFTVVTAYQWTDGSIDVYGYNDD